MMKPELLFQIRNILLYTAGVCFVLNLLMFLATVGLWDTWTGITSAWFHTTPESLGPAMVNFFAVVKFYVLFLLVAPAVALHLAAKSQLKAAS